MNKIEISKKYKKKINDLKKHNKLYFELSSPQISDSQYDQIKKEIIDLEKKYIFLKNISSPSSSLGYAPSKIFEKSIHRVKMLSLSNAFNKEDL